MHLYMAIFWLVLGLVMQMFMDEVKSATNLSLDRVTMGIIFLILSAYNLIRWDFSRRSVQDQETWSRRMPTKPTIVDPDPTFDFSDKDPADDKKDRPAR